MGARSGSGGFVQATAKSFVLRQASPPWTATSTRPGGVRSMRAVTAGEVARLPAGSVAVTVRRWGAFRSAGGVDRYLTKPIGARHRRRERLGLVGKGARPGVGSSLYIRYDRVR